MDIIISNHDNLYGLYNLLVELDSAVFVNLKYKI
jgi:hypothetical protein